MTAAPLSASSDEFSISGLTAPSDLCRSPLSDSTLQFLSCIPMGAMIMDADGVFRFSNPQADRLAGGTSLAGRHIEDVVPRSAAQERLRILRSAIDSAQCVRVVGVQKGVRRQWLIFPAAERDGLGGCALIFTTGGATGSLADDSIPTIQLEHEDWGELAELTEREREVLALIAQGMSTREIAKSLNRSVKTIEFHRSALGAKLGATNRVELTRIALRAGLVDLH